MLLSKKTNDEIEKACHVAEVNLRYNFEYAVELAVAEAYKRGYDDGRNERRDKDVRAI